VAVISDRHQEKLLEAHSISTTRCSLGVLSTPIVTQWKGLAARRNLCSSRLQTCSDNANRLLSSKIKLAFRKLRRVDDLESRFVFVHNLEPARSCVHRFCIGRHVKA
jgi:hypothetical protein